MPGPDAALKVRRGAPRTPRVTSSRRNRSRYLLVEDDASLRSVLAQVLTESGRHVVAVSDPMSALRAAEQERFDGVVCDYSLPGMNGLALLKRFAEVKPSLAARFVLVTGAAADEPCRAYAAVRPERVLFKPFRNEALLAALDALAAPGPAPVDAAPAAPPPRDDAPPSAARSD